MALFHSDKGSVGYNLVGTPTVVDGYISEIDDSNYAELSSYATDTNISDYEFATEVIIPEQVDNNREHILSYRAGSLEGIAFLKNSHIIRWYIARREGTTSDISITSSLTLSAGDKVIIHCSYLGNKVFQLAVSKDNGVTWTKDTLVQGDYNFNSIDTTQYFRFGIGVGSISNYYFNGTININKTYIKVNGQAWFGVCPVEVKHIDYGTPVSYTVTGTPTIVDGVATNLSGNTIDIANFPFLTKNWEVVVKANTTYSSSQTQQRAWTRGDFFLRVYGSSSRWQVYNGSVIWISPDASYSIDNYPYAKLVKNGSTVTAYLSSDGVNYTKVAEDIALNTPAADGIFHFGSTVNGWLGSIDLNESYIKVEGKLWFFRPSTDYVKANDKLVFADSGLYIEVDGVKTYATKDLAPVPAGYPIGNTTTSAIGWVDMRTQTFTAAPEGAILAKDEVSAESES